MNSAATERSLSLAQLCILAELPRRTVRYYIQIGLVDRPIGETRAAYSTDSHLQQLLTIRKWTDAGLSLERIRELLEGADPAVPPPRPRKAGSVEVMSHLIVADGVYRELYDPDWAKQRKAERDERIEQMSNVA